MHDLHLSRRWFVCGTIGLFATSGAPLAGATSFQNLSKALWAWQVAPSDWADLGSFCKAAGITGLMLSLGADVRSQLVDGDADLLGEVASLRHSGLTVAALGGEQDWLTRREATLPASLDEILNIQRQYAPFDGLHLDIEPQLLPAWKSGERSAVAAQYLQLLSRVRSASAGIQLEVTAHPSYAEVNVAGDTFLHQIVNQTDRISLMAYRDQPAAALNFARLALPIFKQSGSAWRFGVLANASREPDISYAETSSGQFQSDMVSLDRMLRAEATKGYEGLIFEDYRGMRSILEPASAKEAFGVSALFIDRCESGIDRRNDFDGQIDSGNAQDVVRRAAVRRHDDETPAVCAKVLRHIHDSLDRVAVEI
jgi:hypothetical protein